MIKLKSLAVSVVTVAAFGVSHCMAQQQSHPSPVNAMPLPIPHATQIKRCEDMGRFAQDTAVAREAGESQAHYIGRLGLNMHDSNGLGLIHQRLAGDMRVPVNPKLVGMICSSKQSPMTWQKKVREPCAQTIG